MLSIWQNRCFFYTVSCIFNLQFHLMNRLLTLALLLSWQITLAQSNKQYQELISTSDKYFKDKLASDHIVGVSAAIVIDGQVIWAKGFGYSDRDRKVPMLPETVVNIGSVTKTFTSLAVMQLHEKGLLNINKGLNTYLPGFHPMSRPQDSSSAVTIRSVITHTSGIQSDIWKNSDFGSGKYTDVLGYINDTYLLYPAGTVALYSNAGYNILGHLIKTVSREDYAAYVHKHIFLPLKMASSGFAMDALKNRTRIYAYGQEFKEYELRDIASGGIYSNINDLAKYAIGMLDAYRGKSNALISQKTAQEMFALSNAGVRIETNKKGLGWFEFRNDSTFAPYHAGSAGFAQAKLLLFPDKNAAVMVLTNTAEGGKTAEEFCFNMLPRFGLSISDLFPSPINIPASTTTVSPAKLALQEHVGSYASSAPYTTIRLDNGNLNMESGGNVTLLKPVSSNEYIPYTIKGSDTVIKDKQRYFFNDIGSYHYLIQRNKNREYTIGYRLRPVDTLAWKQRRGLYEQYGYQMLIGDSKFKSIEIYITPDQMLMCRLKTMGSSNEIPLDVIDSNHAMTTNLNSGFGGFTVTFYNEGGYQIVNLGGLTFRK